MKPGQASQTAVMVCQGRALAHGATWAGRFADPTALVLLPDAARRQAEDYRAGIRPAGIRGFLKQVRLNALSHAMAARTVAIDDAVRTAANPQVVILGAGLDGRAWRIRDLSDVTVFEADHPDSQRDKRVRIASLPTMAREVRFVPVDFAHDRLDAALAAADHDATRPTTWIWEGVVMYLTVAEIEATLAAVERRSVAGSVIIVAYHAPSALLHFVQLLVRRVGEPLRSSFTADAMRQLLARHGFGVLHDEDLPTVAATVSADVVRATRSMKYWRTVSARRQTPAYDSGEVA